MKYISKGAINELALFITWCFFPLMIIAIFNILENESVDTIGIIFIFIEMVSILLLLITTER